MRTIQPDQDQGGDNQERDVPADGRHGRRLPFWLGTLLLLAGLLLFLVGVGFTAWSANSQATLQLAAPDCLRGRIISLYFYAFMGTGPFAGLFAGWLCAKGGTELAFAIAGGVGLLAVVAAALKLGWSPRYAPLGRRESALREA